MLNTFNAQKKCTKNDSHHNAFNYVLFLCNTWVYSFLLAFHLGGIRSRLQSTETLSDDEAPEICLQIWILDFVQTQIRCNPCGFSVEIYGLHHIKQVFIRKQILYGWPRNLTRVPSRKSSYFRNYSAHTLPSINLKFSLHVHLE